MAERTDAGSVFRESAGQPRKALEFALIFTVFFVVGGAPAPHVNETYYLTKAKHYWQPDWCAGDPFLESADAQPVFYWSIGWLASYFSLTTVAWIGRTAAWLVLAGAWQRLSSRVFPGPWRGVLSAMMFASLIERTNFAGEWVLGGVEGKCFAYAFVFWGLAALADQKWRAVWPWMGLASAFHVLVGGWSTVAAGLVWVTRSRGERPTFSSMLPSCILGCALALPGLVPAILLTYDVDAQTTAEANTIYVFDRLPHHLAPLKLPLEELLGKAARYEILLLAFVLLWLVCRRNMVESCPARTSAGKLDRLLCFAGWSVMFSGAALGWQAITWDHPVLAARFLKYYWFRLGDIAVPLAVCLAVGWLINHLIGRHPRWAAALLLLAVALPSWQLLTTSGARYRDPCPPADRRTREVSAWQDACEWARTHTPQESLFLVPRSAQSFNWNAHRPDLVTWKEVPQDATALLIWRERLFDVFFHANDAGQQVAFGSLAVQGSARIGELAKKYDIDYVVTQAYPPLDLPVAYSNAHYKIYSIPGP